MPIETRCAYLEEAGVRFAVRRAAGLEPKAQRPGAGHAHHRADPFLPYEDDLYVADLSPTHVALLNKYNVFEHHLLIITRAYEDQEAWLTAEDFHALWLCMAAGDAVGFYNGGRVAGASQPHKHLQVVPLPLCDAGAAIPLSPLLAPALRGAEVGQCAALPFVHALCRVPPAWWHDVGEGTRHAFLAYQALLRRVGLWSGPARTAARRPRPYNLIVSREWMLLVPRRRETYGDITINALGLVGALLVKDQAQFNLLQRTGPMAALRHVTVARGESVGHDYGTS